MPEDTNTSPGNIVLVGFPFDAYSSYLRGAAEAPPLIREAFWSPHSDMWTETGVNLARPGLYTDHGDIALAETEQAFAIIEDTITRMVERDQRPVSLGGDHSISYPILRGIAKKYRPLTILHFDAHPDLHDEFEGSRLSHACPFARIMEEGLATRLVQVGIRMLNDHQREQIQRFGVELVEMRNFQRAIALRFDTPVYVSFDIDGLDPAFAPGVSHHEPGGMSTRQALDVIHRLHQQNVPVIGADIVEFNPRRDFQGITAAASAKILKEILGVMDLCPPFVSIAELGALAEAEKEAEKEAAAESETGDEPAIAAQASHANTAQDIAAAD
ncbi:MAG: agmatinase [Blastocatellia bacterium]